MGKLSTRWPRARSNTTPSTRQVQFKIDESAAHCSLIVFDINSTANLSITLYIIMHFCGAVHLAMVCGTVSHCSGRLAWGGSGEQDTTAETPDKSHTPGGVKQR
ncbi:hypothetical protein EYF80_036870 [Liparis tanakae]|uniref:Uncharacterized protein n=1 Tax=Liparis tanakae TaxID=230148 RepID=A0A4Z2GJK9_9TELE|nr:hypothetical protein EYF80_036870 [Liparis tanakae]